MSSPARSGNPVARPDARADYVALAQAAAAGLKALIRAFLRAARAPEAVLFMDTLPCNKLGKLLRREVRTLFTG